MSFTSAVVGSLQGSLVRFGSLAGVRSCARRKYCTDCIVLRCLACKVKRPARVALVLQIHVVPPVLSAKPQLMLTENVRRCVRKVARIILAAKRLCHPRLIERCRAANRNCRSTIQRRCRHPRVQTESRHVEAVVLVVEGLIEDAHCSQQLV